MCVWKPVDCVGYVCVQESWSVCIPGLWDCIWVFFGIAHETVLGEPVCLGTQCVHLDGISVAHVCFQAHVVCVYIVVRVECEYSG